MARTPHDKRCGALTAILDDTAATSNDADDRVGYERAFLDQVRGSRGEAVIDEEESSSNPERSSTASILTPQRMASARADDGIWTTRAPRLC